MRPSTYSFLLAVSLVLGVTNTARADFNLEITGGSTTVTAGGTATVDFMITSNSPTGLNLAGFNLELQITTVTGTSNLQFTTNQPNPFSRSGYVFSGASLDQSIGSPFWGSPGPPNLNKTISGGDYNVSNLGYTTISSSSNYLLASVQVQADPNASVGDSFNISLVADPSQTYFQDPNFNNISYTSTAGTVTVVPALSLPEPSQLVMLAIGGLTVLALQAFRGLVRVTHAP